LAFNRLLTNKGPLKNRVEFFGDAFFIPLFLIFVGMQVDIQVLTSSADVWFVMGLMTITVIVTKWMAAFLSAKMLGFSNDQAWVVFGLTNSQAAATLAAVFVGMEVGLIGEEVLNGAIMMILITCIIGPMVVEKFGFRLADDTTIEIEEKTDIRQRILVPLSNPATSARLIEFASNLKLQNKAPIYPLSVINTYKDAASQRDRARKILELASGQIHAVNSEASPVMETNLNVAEGIRLAAEKNAISDIVIGWNGEITTTSRVFGSIVDQMLGTTRQQAFICKIDQPLATFKKIRLVISPQNLSGKNFMTLFGMILRLAENLNTPVEIMHLEKDESQIQKNISLIALDLNITLKSFKTFDKLMEEIPDSVKSTDLLVVINKRGGSTGWAYGTNLIPRILASKKPEASFIIAYSGSTEMESYLTDLIFTN
jgi:hypothetical protein